MPVEQGCRERRRAEGPDHRLTLALVAEGLKEGQLALMNSDDPARPNEKVQMNGKPFGQGAIPVAVLSAREAYHVELEVLAVIVEVRRLLRIEQFPDRTAIQVEETGQMLHLIPITAINVHPQERPLVEANKALLVEPDLLVVSVGVIEKGLDHGPMLASKRLVPIKEPKDATKRIEARLNDAFACTPNRRGSTP